MMLPTFIGIGAQRAGTTWAYNCLAQHPEVYMSEKKELHFFYANYSRGLDWYAAQFAPRATPSPAAKSARTTCTAARRWRTSPATCRACGCS